MSVCSVLLATFVVVSLTSFVHQVEEAVDEEISGLGYDFLITARGCPYEAATLMLRGGVGMRYMPDTAIREIQTDSEIASSFPLLIHPLRDPASETGMMLVRGMARESFEANGLSFVEGRPFESEELGVVLGYEAAELEQRGAGSSFLLPGTLEVAPKEVPVLGVLQRSGTQIDGSVLMPVSVLQEHYGLQGKLTGIGVQLTPEAQGNVEGLIERYESDPALQVVQLSAVASRLRSATAKMSSLAFSMSTMVVFLAFFLVMSIGILRSGTEQQQVHVLHASGISVGFLVLCSGVETLIVLSTGVLLGGVSVSLFGSLFVGFFEETLPYVPEQLTLGFGAQSTGVAVLVILLVSVVSALPQWVRIRRSRPMDLRGI